MSDQDVFNSNTPTEQTNPVENKPTEVTTPDVFVEKLMTITREDGTPKYESVTDALEALRHSQEHIKKLEAERKNEKEQLEYLKKKAEETETLKQTLERLSNKQMTEEKPNPATPASGGLSEEKVVELFEQMQTKKQQEAVALANLKAVSETLASKYGEKAQEVVKTKAAELGMTLDELKAFSAQKPNAALALFGEAPKKAPTPSTSSVHIPPNTSQNNVIERPKESLISGRGATDKNRIDLIKRIKEKVYAEHGLT